MNAPAPTGGASAAAWDPRLYVQIATDLRAKLPSPPAPRCR
jgi:hypothetical protein